MSEANQQEPVVGNSRTGTNPPTHVAYHVRDGKTGKGFWTRVGSAWAHKDGKGFNIQLDVAPLDGRISLRLAEEKQ
ncbi:MAG: hypothetical protein P4L99_17150 [Chthoniobacter sp.]|nr:hypothetical protein [Chthoniobacter sp.]